MKIKDNEKCREWERRRRDRLSDAFKLLAELLPNYDPAKIPPKIEILENSTQFIKELRLSNSRLLSNQTDSTDLITKVKNLQDEINKLILRVKQLTLLLTKAKIPIPTGPYIKSLGKKKLKWSNKIRGENVENIQTVQVSPLPAGSTTEKTNALISSGSNANKKTVITVIGTSSPTKVTQPSIPPPTTTSLEAPLNKSTKENSSVPTIDKSNPQPFSFTLQPQTFFLTPIQQTQFLTPYNLATTPTIQLQQQGLIPKVSISTVQKIPIRPLRRVLPLQPKKPKKLRPKRTRSRKKGKEFGTQTQTPENNVTPESSQNSSTIDKSQGSSAVEANTDQVSSEVSLTSAVNEVTLPVDSDCDAQIVTLEPCNPIDTSICGNASKLLPSHEISSEDAQSDQTPRNDTRSNGEPDNVNNQVTSFTSVQPVEIESTSSSLHIQDTNSTRETNTRTESIQVMQPQNEDSSPSIQCKNNTCVETQILADKEETLNIETKSATKLNEQTGSQIHQPKSTSSNLFDEINNIGNNGDQVSKDKTKDDTPKNSISLWLPEDPLSSISTDKISECIARSIGLIEHPEESELLELETTDWGDVDDTQSHSPKSSISPTQMFLSKYPFLPKETIVEPPPPPNNQSHPHNSGTRQPSTSRSSFYIDSMLPDESNASTPSHLESIITTFRNTVTPLPPFVMQSTTATPPPSRSQEVKNRNSSDSLDTIFAPLQNMRDKRNNEILSLASFINLDSGSSNSKRPCEETTANSYMSQQKKRMLTPLQPVTMQTCNQQQPIQKSSTLETNNSHSFFPTAPGSFEATTQKMFDNFATPGATQLLPSLHQSNFTNLEPKSYDIDRTSSNNYSYFYNKQNYGPRVQQGVSPSHNQNLNSASQITEKKSPRKTNPSNAKQANSKSSQAQLQQQVNPTQSNKDCSQNQKNQASKTNTGRSRNQPNVVVGSSKCGKDPIPNTTYQFPVHQHKQVSNQREVSQFPSNQSDNTFQPIDFLHSQRTSSYNPPVPAPQYSYTKPINEPSKSKDTPFFIPPQQPNQQKNHPSPNQIHSVVPFSNSQSSQINFSNFDFYNHHHENVLQPNTSSTYASVNSQQKRVQNYAQASHYSPTHVQNPVAQNNQRFALSHSQVPPPSEVHRDQPNLHNFNSQGIIRPNSSTGQRPVNWMTDAAYKKDNTNANTFSVSKLVGGPSPQPLARVPPLPPPNHCAESLIRPNTTSWNDFHLSSFSHTSAEPPQYQQQQTQTYSHSTLLPQNEQPRNDYLYTHTQQQQPIQQNNYDRNLNFHHQFEHTPQPQPQQTQHHPSPHQQQQQQNQFHLGVNSGGGSSSISNFNLSSIFPEINDKRQGNVNQSNNNCNYYPPNRK